jgi:MFS transporter, putative metabolite:H+ symporter
MASPTGSSTFPFSEKSREGAHIIARQDRIPAWSFPYAFIAIIGVGFLFTFYDIFDINISFIQTCTQIVPGCTPVNAASHLGLPVLLNLVGYVIGAIFLSPLADRFGRRNILVVTLVITGLGSLYNALAGDYTNFIIARAITGVGIGADLAIVNTYISEVAPVDGRAKYNALIFVMSGIGALIAVWLGLYLTTPAAPFPFGLPFAIAGGHFEGVGWRIMYGLGALLAVIGILLRFELPESPRWLVMEGRFAEADRVVTKMEQSAIARIGELPSVPADLPVLTHPEQVGYGEILRNPLYLKRSILLLCIWLLCHATLYSNAAGFTVILVALGYAPPVAGLIVAIGVFGFLIGAYIAYAFGEKMERKYWLPVAAVLTLIGGLIIVLGGHNNIPVAALGAVIIFIGTDIFVPIAYAWSTENYPTRARAAGFALVEGGEHIGGGLAVILIGSIISTVGPLGSFLLLGGYLVVASVLALFGTSTRNKRLDEVAP